MGAGQRSEHEANQDNRNTEEKINHKIGCCLIDNQKEALPLATPLIFLIQLDQGVPLCSVNHNFKRMYLQIFSNIKASEARLHVHGRTG